MIRTVAVQRIQQGLGFSATLADSIVLRMQEEQRDLERGKTLPDFLLVEDAPLSLAAHTTSVSLPTNFLRRSNQVIRYTVPGGATLGATVPWREYDAAFEAYGASDAGGPSAAVLRNTSILFLPASDRAYTLTWTYYRKDDKLDADIENLWLANAPELIIGGAGLRIAKDKRDANAIALFGDMYKQARSTWFGETIVQESEDGPMLLGSNA